MADDDGALHAAPTPLSVHEPEGEPRGGVIVIQEAFGVNGHIEQIGRRFAVEGYLAVIPHLYHRTGDVVAPYDDWDSIMPAITSLKAEEILVDLDAALDLLADRGVEAGHVGVVGFCMGGTVALMAAVERPIGAAATFYGGGIKKGRFGFPALAEEAPHLQAPWIGFFGDLDKGIAVDDVEELRGAAATSDHPTEVHRYPEAEHGFNCDERPSYHEASAKDAWGKTLIWFDQHL